MRLCCVQVIRQSVPLIYVIFDVVLTAMTKNYCFMRCDAVWIGRYRRFGRTWLPHDVGKRSKINSCNFEDGLNLFPLHFKFISTKPHGVISHFVNLDIILVFVSRNADRDTGWRVRFSNPGCGKDFCLLLNVETDRLLGPPTLLFS